MGKNAKLGIAAGVIGVLGLIAFFLIANVVLGLLIIIIGAGVIIFMLKKMADDEDAGISPRRKNAKSKLDTALESRKSGTDTKPAPRTSSGGLPTWNPTALDSWQPPSLSEDAEEATAGPAAETSWDTWDTWSDEGDTVTVDEDEDEDNPLDALDRLDDIDPIAEVERLDAADELDEFEGEFTTSEVDAEPDESATFSFGSAPPVINEEEIKTADDIMAASHATELELPVADPDGDSELARLLAKVQARLSAYE